MHCGGVFNGNCEENIEPNSFSDTPFGVKYYINIAKRLVLSISFLFFPILTYINVNISTRITRTGTNDIIGE